jgi:cobalamin synthase
MNKYIKTIQNSSRLGLWGSVAAVILTVVFFYVSRYRFYPSDYTARWMTVAGTLLAVLAVSMTLLTVRRQVPRLRQTEGLEPKLRGYAGHVRSLYLTMCVVVVLLCAVTLFSARNVLLMLALVCTLVLFLNYPNIYRIKVDLGLTDDEMHTLFGDKYIGGNEQ